MIAANISCFDSRNNSHWSTCLDKSRDYLVLTSSKYSSRSNQYAVSLRSSIPRSPSQDPVVYSGFPLATKYLVLPYKFRCCSKDPIQFYSRSSPRSKGTLSNVSVAMAGFSLLSIANEFGMSNKQPTAVHIFVSNY